MDFNLPPENDPRRLEIRTFFEANPRPTGRQLAERGDTVPDWPRPWGLGADPELQLIIDEEFEGGGMQAPARRNPVARNNCALSLLMHGTGDQRDRLWR